MFLYGRSRNEISLLFREDDVAACDHWQKRAAVATKILICFPSEQFLCTCCGAIKANSHLLWGFRLVLCPVVLLQNQQTWYSIRHCDMLFWV